MASKSTTLDPNALRVLTHAHQIYFQYPQCLERIFNAEHYFNKHLFAPGKEKYKNIEKEEIDIL